MKTILTIICFILLLTTIIIILVLIDFCIIKNINKSNTTTLIEIKSNNSDDERGPFRWNHCGQTHVIPSIDPNLLIKKLVKRIVGGENAIAHSWPFLVSVRVKTNKSEHHCGGTLISDQHVLTAAHCVIAYIKLLKLLSLNITQINSLIEVHVGINQHESNANYLTDQHIYGVEYFIFHEKFDFKPSVLYNDIALIHLNRKVNLNRPEVNVICLPSSENADDQVKIGENVVAIGWGTYAEEFNYTDFVREDVQQAVFTVKDQNEPICNSGDIGSNWDKNHTVCAHGHDRVKSTCYGDSGGPVLAYRGNRWMLFGIISFGHEIRDSVLNKKKCNASMPFYFAKVSSFREWILNKTNHTIVNF